MIFKHRKKNEKNIIKSGSSVTKVNSVSCSVNGTGGTGPRNRLYLILPNRTSRAIRIVRSDKKVRLANITRQVRVIDFVKPTTSEKTARKFRRFRKANKDRIMVKYKSLGAGGAEGTGGTGPNKR